MTWFKVDDQLWGHPKWLAASPPARSLWITSGSWCAAQLTDGFVPRHVLAVLGGRPRDAVELVKVGLWHEEAEGWRFHDWGDFQPTRDQVEAERSAARDRMRNLRQGRRGSGDVQANSDGTSADVLDPRPDPSRPDPSNPPSSSHNNSSRGAPRLDDDDVEEARIRVAEAEAAGVEIQNPSGYFASILRDVRSERQSVYRAPMGAQGPCFRVCDDGWLAGEGGLVACPECLPGAAAMQQGRN